MKFLKHVRLALVGDIDVTFYISIVNDPELGLVIGPLAMHLRSQQIGARANNSTTQWATRLNS